MLMTSCVPEVAKVNKVGRCLPDNGSLTLAERFRCGSCTGGVPREDPGVA
jgi:hypothetical protein